MGARIVCYTVMRRVGQAVRRAYRPLATPVRVVRRVAPVVVCTTVPGNLMPWAPGAFDQVPMVTEAVMPAPMAPILSEQALLEVAAYDTTRGTAPEPQAIALLGVGLLGLIVVVRFAKKKESKT